MGHYPFTLFDGITLLVLALTLLLVWRRFRGALAANWPLICYAVIVGYTMGFSGGLNPYWVAAGVACAVAIRLVFTPGRCGGSKRFHWGMWRGGAWDCY